MKNFVAIAVLVGFMGAILAPTEGTLCAPSCTDEHGDPVPDNSKVVDPADCANYYECHVTSDGTTVISDPMKCGVDEIYDSRKGECQDVASKEQPGLCDGLCNPCKVTCSHDEEVLPHPTNCNSYYVCDSSLNAVKMNCPAENPDYDYITEKCTYTDAECYHFCDPCVPHCTKIDEVVRDPQDCNRYYVCDPPNHISYPCSDRQTFNQTIGDCTDSINCLEIPNCEDNFP